MDIKTPTGATMQALADNTTRIELAFVRDALAREVRLMDAYRLPDGREVRIDATAAKGAAVVSFTLKDGQIVDATLIARLTDSAPPMRHRCCYCPVPHSTDDRGPILAGETVSDGMCSIAVDTWNAERDAAIEERAR